MDRAQGVARAVAFAGDVDRREGAAAWGGGLEGGGVGDGEDDAHAGRVVGGGAGGARVVAEGVAGEDDALVGRHPALAVGVVEGLPSEVVQFGDVGAEVEPDAQGGGLWLGKGGAEEG